MDEAKIPNIGPDEPENTENESKYLDILTNEDTFNTNQLSSSEFAPKLKEIRKERKDLGSHLKEDKSVHERAIQVTSKERISQEHEISSENQDKCATFRPKFKPIRKGKKGNRKKRLEGDKVQSLQSEKNTDEKDTKQEVADISSEKKVNNFRNSVSKYLRRALTRPMRNSKFFWKKGKKPKTSESNKSLAKEKYASQMDKFQQISNEEGVSGVELEALEYSTEIVNTGKRNGKSDTLVKLEMQPETSTKSKEETLLLSSTNSTSSSEIQNYSETRTPSSKVTVAEKVLGNFRWFMQSSTKSVDTFKSEDSIHDDTKLFLESKIRPLNEFKETESESRDLEHTAKSASNFAIQNLKDLTKEKPELIMTENSRKVTNSEVSVTKIDNSKSLIKTIKGTPRQRTVYDERHELTRMWVEEHIKDKGQCLKLIIKEGIYSDDNETKMRCIERAEALQEETDDFLDELDDCDKMENSPKGFNGYSNSNKDHYSISPAPRKKDLRWPEGQIRNLSDLFDYIYKFSNFESNIKNVYKRIYQKTFSMDYDIYVATKKEKDTESKVIENKGRNGVDKFYIALIKYHSKVRKEIPHAEIRSSEDYINYVHNLIIAAKKNLTCLKRVIAELSSMIIPLHIYISQARNRFVMTCFYLQEERSDIFL